MPQIGIGCLSVRVRRRPSVVFLMITATAISLVVGRRLLVSAAGVLLLRGIRRVAGAAAAGILGLAVLRLAVLRLAVWRGVLAVRSWYRRRGAV
jgi:hypothetical protein